MRFLYICFCSFRLCFALFVRFSQIYVCSCMYLCIYVCLCICPILPQPVYLLAFRSLFFAAEWAALPPAIAAECARSPNLLSWRSVVRSLSAPTLKRFGYTYVRCSLTSSLSLSISLRLLSFSLRSVCIFCFHSNTLCTVHTLLTIPNWLNCSSCPFSKRVADTSLSLFYSDTHVVECQLIRSPLSRCAQLEQAAKDHSTQRERDLTCLLCVVHTLFHSNAGIYSTFLSACMCASVGCSCLLQLWVRTEYLFVD